MFADERERPLRKRGKKMKKRLTAEQAIEKLENQTHVIFGVTAKKNTPFSVRTKLCAMAERNEISPKEYYRALKLTKNSLVGGELRAEMADAGFEIAPEVDDEFTAACKRVENK